MQWTPYNLNLLGKSKNVSVIGSLKQITKNKEEGMEEECKYHLKDSKRYRLISGNILKKEFSNQYRVKHCI